MPPDASPVARGAQLRTHAGRVAAWLTPVAFYLVFPGHLVLGSQLFIWALFALSLDLLLGYAGIVSLGHAAFFGVGAYTAGLLSVHGWGEPISGLLAAACVAALLGLLTSPLVTRGESLTRLMVTLAVGFLAHEAANRASSVTGGTDGLSGVVVWPVLGIFGFDLLGRTAYVYAGAVTLVCLLGVRRIVSSPFGLSLRAIRDNERRMPAIGVPVQRRLTSALVISAALAGVAGALSAQTTAFVGLEAASFERSASVLVMLVLGGTGRLYGAFVGTVAFISLREAFSDLHPAYWQFWIGICIALIGLFAPGGVLGWSARIVASGALQSRGRAERGRAA
jgi:branched-chain amino acid transport system permease protein